jgi:uncharacterized protein YggL (DUF469 family)
MPRSKRLRKKLHLLEYREFGFEICFRFSADLSEEARNSLIDDFIREAIEANGLQFGGGGSDNVWDGFATLDAKRGTATEAHREKVIGWLTMNPKILQYRVGDLADAWYDHEHKQEE